MIQFTTPDPDLDEAISCLDLEDYGFDEAPGRALEALFVDVHKHGGVQAPAGYEVCAAAP